MLELFYTWQLMQVKMIHDIPIILLGEMWSDFVDWIKKWSLENGFIEQKDVDLLFLVNNNEEALQIINMTYEKFERG